MSAKWDKPEETLKLLDELEKFGFNDDAFWRLHHWREKKDRRRATIKAHRAYCEKHEVFRTGENPLVQERLQKVLSDYKSQPSYFNHLAEEAYRAIPPRA
jgi:hypothetical protein